MGEFTQEEMGYMEKRDNYEIAETCVGEAIYDEKLFKNLRDLLFKATGKMINHENVWRIGEKNADIIAEWYRKRVFK